MYKYMYQFIMSIGLSGVQFGQRNTEKSEPGHDLNMQSPYHQSDALPVKLQELLRELGRLFRS